jgi:hypothetical protein
MGPIIYFRALRDLLLNDLHTLPQAPELDELTTTMQREIRAGMGWPESPYAALIAVDEFAGRGHPGAMTTKQPMLPVPRNKAANDARTRRSQETAAAKLTAGGWLCFPPETVPALRAVIATHDELTGWKA